MAGIGIIVNRNAGRSQAFRGRIGEKLAFVLGDSASLKETFEVSEIETVARLFQERKIDILGIGGGDGSNQQVLSKFIHVYGNQPLPKVLFLRGGTHNACARSIGLKGSPERILERLVRKYHSNERIETTCRSMLRLEDDSGVRYGFTLATGFLYQFFERMHRGRHDSPWKVACLIASLFGSFFVRSKNIKRLFNVPPARVTLAKEALEWEHCNGIAASSMEQVGLGMKPFPRANETLGTFHALAFRIHPGRFAHVSWRLLRGRLENHPQHLSTITDSLIIEADEPIPFALDGDLFRGGPCLKISTGPRLKLVLV
jgi:diacylglycerol kinase family enzyme